MGASPEGEPLGRCGRPRAALKVGGEGRAPVGTQRLRLEKPPGPKVVLGRHPSGLHSVLAAAPAPLQKPARLFTNRPK